VTDRVRFTGQDGATADFEVVSFTDQGTVYDVRIDYHAGRVLCDCKDALCRRKWAPIGPYCGLGCKHIRLVLLFLEELGIFGGKDSA